MSSATSSSRPRYSVVIVTYNSLANIQVCLDSLRRCAGHALAGGAHEYIVVDNDSRDGTPAYLSAQGDVKAILNRTNNGFSKGCNQGAAIAEGEFLVFLNPDTLVTPGWTSAMARYFEDPTVGAVGPVSNYVAGLQRLDLNLPEAWRGAQSFPGTGAAEVAENLAGILREGNAGRGIVTRLLIGFCLMMDRKLFLSMGGMDEDLFLGNDDLDLSWRLRNENHKLVVASDSFVFHEGQKSFKTEKKSRVDQLVQESTDALYRKLVKHYGGREKVPAAQDLWGIGWFNPSPELVQGELSPAEATMQTLAQPTQAWTGVSALIYLGPPDQNGGKANADRLERSLATLPARPSPEVILLNCSGSGAVTASPAAVRKLDLGAWTGPKQALESALASIRGSHVLFCLAGVEFSTLFNHWLDKRPAETLGQVQPLPMRLSDGREAKSTMAFLASIDWLRPALAATPNLSNPREFLSVFGERIRSAVSGRPADPPWLLAPGLEDTHSFGAASAATSWTPVKVSQIPADIAPNPPASVTSGLTNIPPSLTDILTTLRETARKPSATTSAIGGSTIVATAINSVNDSTSPQVAGDIIGLYPESLRAALRAAREFGLAGSDAETPPVAGPVRVFDAKGKLAPLSGQDLVILRVTQDILENLPDRMRNIRAQARGLKQFIVVCNAKLALGLKPTQESILAPVDLTGDGIRVALHRAGFAPTAERPYRGFPESVSDGSNLEGWLQIEAIPRNAQPALGKLVSIVILGFNQVEYTRKCIESIQRHTRQQYELILVDNGSKDGTEKYFRSLTGAKIIRNAKNLGVAKGWNQGMRKASGDYILILNNDVIVGPEWLENMVRLAESDAKIGLVGPRSNYIAGPQVVPSVPYKAESEIQTFIAKWQKEHDLSAAEFKFIKGFCHLIPRRAFTAVGLYDERYGKGNFEDDDYCMRVHLHGFKALIANDSFIHHFGSVSFNQESVDWNALMIENKKKFERKWANGAAALNDTQVDTQVSDPDAGASEADAADAGLKAAIASLEKSLRVEISLPGQSAPRANASSSTSAASDGAKATKNSNKLIQEGLAAYSSGNLDQARNIFLQAQTQDPANSEVYCNLGVVCFHENKLPDATEFFLKALELNPNHPDAAQNLLDCLAQGNIPMVLEDMDSLAARFPTNPVLASAQARASVMKDSPAATPIASMAVASNSASDDKGSSRWSPAPDGLPDWRAEIEGLIASGEALRATERVEARLKTGQDAGICHNYLGIIAHAGSETALALQHFFAAAKHCPAEPDIIFNLSDTLIAMGRAADAVRVLEDASQNSAQNAAEAAVDFAACAEQLRAAKERGKIDADLLDASREANHKGEALLRAGKTEDAAPYFDAVLEADPDDFRALNNLGLCAWYQGKGESAWRSFSKCLALRPTWKDALINAFDTALALGRIEDMRPLLDRADAAAPGAPAGSGHEITEAMRGHIRREGQAIYSCESFDDLQDGYATLDRGEKAMREGRQGDAILAFLEAMRNRSENPQALNGLGIIAFAEKRFADAFGLFEAAAALHPLDQDILLNLWQGARALQREREVLPKLRKSLERNPALEEVRAVVKEYA